MSSGKVAAPWRSCVCFFAGCLSPTSLLLRPLAGFLTPFLPSLSPPPTLEKGSGSLSQWHNGFCPFRAAEWQLDQPSWSGRLRITAKGQVAYIKLEDRTSGKGQGGLRGAEVPRLPLCKGRGGWGLAKPLRESGDLSWRSEPRYTCTLTPFPNL